MNTTATATAALERILERIADLRRATTCQSSTHNIIRGIEAEIDGLEYAAALLFGEMTAEERAAVADFYAD